MLRSNGDTRKIREGNLVFVSHCSVNASQTRGCARNVFALLDGRTRFAYSSRQEQSNFKSLCRRRGACSSAVLDAISYDKSMHDYSPTPNITSAFGRSRRDGQCMDKAQEVSGAYWIKTLRYLAATGSTARTPVRAARSGTAPRRSRAAPRVALRL